MDPVAEFLARYEREYDYYCETARVCEALCRSLLQKNGIRAMVTSRGKDPASLRDKLLQRSARRPYPSVEAIYSDIVDLCGVRIALYFPNHVHDLPELFPGSFHLNHVRRFPDRQRQGDRSNGGYQATHYLVTMREEALPAGQHRYAHCPIEIQVASVLMHAWSEVEHDLVYKARAGQLSDAELRILDEINGIVLEGEKALERLYQAGDDRLMKPAVTIRNRYELSALLHNLLKRRGPLHPAARDLHPVDLAPLMDELQAARLNNAAHIEKLFAGLQFDPGQPPLRDQLLAALQQQPPLPSDSTPLEAGPRF